MIRTAVIADIGQLVDLETRCFETDRLSERSFRHLLTHGNASLKVDAEDGRLRGYSVVLFHRNTALARLYSLAVDPGCRGQGIARALITAAEQDALEHGTTRMRLEVHQDNRHAQDIYRDLGYREFAVYPDYYHDHASALRMEKRLAPHLATDLYRAPYYAQTLEFTCGPACLLMAMKGLDPQIAADRAQEIQIWRESTTIFMTSGLGGCGPLGLALAAVKRGFDVEVAVSDETEIFVSSVRSEEKREVIRLVENQFANEAAQAGIAISPRPLSAADLCRRFAEGGVPIILISAYRLTGDKEAHWIAMTAVDERFIYVNDPYVDRDEDKTETDCIGIPILRRDLDRMMRLGRKKHFAAVVLYQKGTRT